MDDREILKKIAELAEYYNQEMQAAPRGSITVYQAMGAVQALAEMARFVRGRDTRQSMESLAATRTPRSRVQRYAAVTSFEAAVSQVPEKALAQYHRIYETLVRTGPLTHEELIAEIRRGGHTVTESGTRARTAELKSAGWVRDSRKKGRTQAGHPAIKWEAVEA